MYVYIKLYILGENINTREEICVLPKCCDLLVPHEKINKMRKRIK